MYLVDLGTSEAQTYFKFAKVLSSFQHLTSYSDCQAISSRSYKNERSQTFCNFQAQLKNALFLLSSQLGVNMLTHQRHSEESVVL